MANHLPRPFESFVAPARQRAEIWRTALGVCLIATIYAGLGMAMLAAAAWAMGLDGPGAVNPREPRGVLAYMTTFAGLALGTMAVTRLLHRRPVATLFGRGARVLRDFVLAAGLMGALVAASFAIGAIWLPPVPHLDPGTWLALLPLALVALLVQTGAEELAFRGYLQQQLAARFASPIAWAVLPSVLFGLAHYDPVGAGGNAWLFVGATALFGLAAADLTARTGSIGAAWGFHWVNNIGALLIVSIDGPLAGLALYTTPFGPDAPILRQLIWIDMATIVLGWLILRRVLAR